MSHLARPPALRAGGRVAVVAPSGPVAAQRFDRGLKVLRRALDASFTLADNVFDQAGYFAGNDATRLAGVRAALEDKEVEAIMCTRGGYGATRLLPGLDPDLLRANPRPLVGFSDITALLCWAWMRAGVASIHGPVVTQCSTLGPRDLDRLRDLLHGEVPAPLAAEEGTCVHGGRVEGTLVVGNLEVLRSLVGTRYLPPLADTIVAMEDVGERPYRIDRALTQMIQAGAFRGVRGVVVGQLLHCDDPERDADGPSARDVVIERLQPLGIPVVTDFPFGHDDVENAALPFGTMARLDADNCTLECLEPITVS